MQNVQNKPSEADSAETFKAQTRQSTGRNMAVFSILFLYWFQLLLMPNLWQFFVQSTVCTISVFFHNTSPAVPASMHPAYLYFPVNEFVGIF